MNTLRAYATLEDAWAGGVAEWCRAATAHVLAGGHAWMGTTGDGQTNWIKRRLLAEGVTLVGVQFLDVSRLRRELARRLGVRKSTLGRHSLELLLRLHASSGEADDPELAAVARHPAACLAALRDYAAGGWLADGPRTFSDVFPLALHDWLPRLNDTGAWTPGIDAELLRHPALPDAPPLRVCVFGWDASRWGAFDLLRTVARTATDLDVYAPLPRGTSQELQQLWIGALEELLATNFDPCPSSGFVSRQTSLAARLEGVDLDGSADGALVLEPELLVGHGTTDTAALVRGFVARWLAARGDDDESARLAILCSGRSPAAVAVLRALADAKIAVEDEVGELPEPALPLQIQRAILAYHQDDGDTRALLSLIELINESVGSPGTKAPDFLPLEPKAVRHALHEGFVELQHHDARVLARSAGFERATIAGPLRVLLAHLGRWPRNLPWVSALERWEETLRGLGLSTAEIEPLWSQLRGLPIAGEVPSAAFFEFLSGILAGVSPRRSAGTKHRFARVVLTTLVGATGQSWGGAVFLDSNEGSWPIYPGENPFLDDAARGRLNGLRAALAETGSASGRGYLLTAADRAQLEQFRFLEILENCDGPLAFAGVARDPAESGRELHGNEWALRCLADSARMHGTGEALLDRWRAAVRRVWSSVPALPVNESEHLASVHRSRRDPDVPFDAYSYNFSALVDSGDADMTEAWTMRDAEAAWNQPATFALQQLLGAEPADEHDALRRSERGVVGRLVHVWLRAALHGTPHPRPIAAADWQGALSYGLPAARAETERKVRGGLAGLDAPPTDPGMPLPAWWQGTLRRAEWIARRCLKLLADATSSNGEPRWLCMGRTFAVDLPTANGPLRLKAHCDLTLLDRPGLEGASGTLIDIRTGALPKTGSPTPAGLETGRELGLGTTFLLAIAGGLDPVTTTAGFVHPDAADLARWTTKSTGILQPVLDDLATRQSRLSFGQSGRRASGSGRGQAEHLPMATTSIAPATLAAKAGQASAPTPSDDDDECI